MSFIESIPTYHKAMIAALQPTQDKLRDINFKMDAHEEAEQKGSHQCDREYCPYADVDITKDMLSDEELAELEKNQQPLKGELEEQRKAIKRLESYAKFIGSPLPEEDLLK
jgi:predicted RNase H-like nuclease (RuvC/YqgF family)